MTTAELSISHDFNTSSWLILAASCPVSPALAIYCKAFAWWNLLKQFGAKPSCNWAIKTYGISQLAKYVPGNIFHLAGRQAMGMAAGVNGKALAKSTLWELGISAIAAGFFACLALPLKWPGLPMSVSSGGAFILLILINRHHATQ